MKIVLGILAALVIAGAIGGAGYAYLRGSDSEPTYEYAAVEKRDVTQLISMTGKVAPADQVDLSFQETGKVRSMFYNIGDRVTAGDVLVQLDDADVSAQLAQAEAKVKAAQARLSELKRGFRREEVQVQEIELANARAALSDAERALLDALRDAYTRSDDAVRGKVDGMFDGPRSVTPQLVFAPNDSDLKNRVQDERRALEILLSRWQILVGDLTIESNLLAFSAVSRDYLNKVSSFLEDLNLSLVGLESVGSLTQVIIDGYRADVSSARAAVAVAVANLSAKEKNVQDTESQAALENQELVLKQAGTASEQIAVQAAVLEEAEARVDELGALRAKRALAAPFDAVVTKRENEVGEVVKPGDPVVSLIADDNLMLQVFVPEADIAKIALGNTAKVTLDAYGEDTVFDARVVFIDPAETIIEGVPTYKIKLVFLRKDGRIKSGMTADIDIAGVIRNDVLAVPQRAMQRDDEKYRVKILDESGVPREVSVEPGLRGSDGFVEIIEGLQLGDRVITLIKE